MASYASDRVSKAQPYERFLESREVALLYSLVVAVAGRSHALMLSCCSARHVVGACRGHCWLAYWAASRGRHNTFCFNNFLSTRSRLSLEFFTLELSRFSVEATAAARYVVRSVPVGKY